MSLTATVDLKIISAEITAASISNGSGSKSFPGQLLKTIELAAGSGIGAIEVSCLTTRSLVSTNEDLDLTAIPDLRTGTNKTFAKLKLIALMQTSTTTTNKTTVAPGASNGFAAAFADDVVIGPNGVMVLYNADGWTVDSTHKIINVALDHSGSYSLFLLGN